MPLIEKEVIRPGTYWYRDETTGQPRKLVVTPELTKYWADQGNAMLSAGLTVPVPFEHDFDAHPMTPADKLKNNSGWVKEYRLKGDRLFSAVDIQDTEVAKKLPGTIRWTSPWINSFTDGTGREWKNVISHLALTTRPRIIEQEPFGSVAAALSVATSINEWDEVGAKGCCLSNAGRLSPSGQPSYPMAFSLYSGAAFGSFPPPKGKPKPGANGNDTPPIDNDDADLGDDGDTDIPDDGDPSNDDNIDLEPFGDPAGDVSMTELLCDLLGALGVVCEHSDDESQFKRNLYNAAMTKIHELVGKAQNGDPNKPDPKNRANPPGQPPNNPRPGQPGQQNPLIQQEQQPMYMSLEDINKITDPTMKNIAMSMYNENVKLRAELEAGNRTANSLRDAKLKEENDKRQQRVMLLSRVSPKVKADLDAMLALPGMALSMGDGGAVVDPMAQTLAVLEKGLSDLPRLMTTDASALSVHPQPKDAEMMTEERADEIADGFARQMGAPPERKAS